MGSNYIWYGIGSSEINNNPSAQDLENAAKCRWIRFKDASIAAEYKNGKRAPNWNVYNIYDTDGALMFTQDKRSDSQPADTQFKQMIPLKYLRSTRPVEENNKIYSFADAEKGIISEIQEVAVETGHAVHKNYPFYINMSDKNNEITIPAPFSFAKKTEAINAINKLNQLLEKSYTNEITEDFITTSEIAELRKKVIDWMDVQ